MGPGAMSMCFGTMDPNNAGVIRQHGRGRGRQRQVISDATLVHHVLIHGRTMKEAGQLVQPNAVTRLHPMSVLSGWKTGNLLCYCDICNAVVHLD